MLAQYQDSNNAAEVHAAWRLPASALCSIDVAPFLNSLIHSLFFLSCLRAAESSGLKMLSRSGKERKKQRLFRGLRRIASVLRGGSEGKVPGGGEEHGLHSLGYISEIEPNWLTSV